MFTVKFFSDPGMIFCGTREETEGNIRHIIADACRAAKVIINADDIDWISENHRPETESDVGIEINVRNGSNQNSQLRDMSFLSKLKEKIVGELGFFNFNPDNALIRLDFGNDDVVRV